MSLIDEKRDSKGKRESDEEENDKKAIQSMGKAAFGSLFFSLFIFVIGICIIAVASNLDNINKLMPKSTKKKVDKKSKRKCGYEDNTYKTRKGFPKTYCETTTDSSVEQQGGGKKRASGCKSLFEEILKKSENILECGKAEFEQNNQKIEQERFNARYASGSSKKVGGGLFSRRPRKTQEDEIEGLRKSGGQVGNFFYDLQTWWKKKHGFLAGFMMSHREGFIAANDFLHKTIGQFFRYIHPIAAEAANEQQKSSSVFNQLWNKFKLAFATFISFLFTLYIFPAFVGFAWTAAPAFLPFFLQLQDRIYSWKGIGYFSPAMFGKMMWTAIFAMFAVFPVFYFYFKIVTIAFEKQEQRKTIGRIFMDNTFMLTSMILFQYLIRISTIKLSNQVYAAAVLPPIIVYVLNAIRLFKKIKSKVNTA